MTFTATWVAGWPHAVADGLGVTVLVIEEQLVPARALNAGPLSRMGISHEQARGDISEEDSAVTEGRSAGVAAREDTGLAARPRGVRTRSRSRARAKDSRSGCSQSTGRRDSRLGARRELERPYCRAAGRPGRAIKSSNSN